VRDWDIGGPANHSAIGRWVEPSEVAKAAAFLLSDDASGITGIDLPVDAGWLAGVNWLSFAGVPSAR
jgi:NAD(P)-dependent dehydrogenase (short-subunit alcohol dehydrogenase family)